ncbi:NAD-dependent epimerase/dehydratase family protein [Bacillus rubiinfantis]|uniref:NAD-dependent epimerase/dehydratase family protein n=1 Tax=Bacillus rubiinfantis TaxID=1499680 RepID=UPI0005A644FC|nr:NAD-dependent epimerase/dehydratase family protein [Bacillus rubiinfantis]
MDERNNIVMVTGCAGFIGYHVAKRLLTEGYRVLGIDQINDYYDPILKRARLRMLKESANFSFIEDALESREVLDNLSTQESITMVLHFAAQAGVRYSLTNPYVYGKSNLEAFIHILEYCKVRQIPLLYASSSSVYGGNQKQPFSEQDRVETPISLYAATKRANELMAYTYSHLYQLPTIGLRFFTVYGPWGRPDMAIYKFTDAIMKQQPIEIYNHGKMKRDFTYIDDIVEAISRLMNKIPSSQGSHPPYKLYNIGSHKPVELLYLIELLENELNQKAVKTFLPIQSGDVPETFADITELENDINYKPQVSIEEGIKRFVAWYKDYYKIT